MVLRMEETKVDTRLIIRRERIVLGWFGTLSYDEASGSTR